MRLELNPALDIPYLERVYGDDANIIFLIFDAFLSDCLPRWELLATLIEDEDITEAASLIHGLKPSFMMSGMSAIKKKVEQLEIMVKNQVDTETKAKLYWEINNDLNIMVPILRSEASRLQKLS